MMDVLLWLLCISALFPALLSQSCSLTYRYTNWTPVIPNCQAPPGKLLVLPAFRKEAIPDGMYCLAENCCIPGTLWGARFLVMPCLSIMPNKRTRFVIFKSDNPVDTSIVVDNSFRMLDIDAGSGRTSVVARFTTKNPHHNIMCSAKNITILFQRTAHANRVTLKHGFVNYTPAMQFRATCGSEVTVDDIVVMDYRARPLWTWRPGDHLPCHCLLGKECWHFNGIFFDGRLGGKAGGIVATAHFHSGFFLVDVRTGRIKWAVAENWPHVRDDVRLQRCADSPLNTVWCGPSHRAQHIGGNVYLLFINGCLAVDRYPIDMHNQDLCHLMNCPDEWNNRSSVFVVQVFEDRQCYSVLEEIPVPFQSLKGRAQATPFGHIATDKGTFTRRGRRLTRHQTGVTGGLIYSSVPIHIRHSCDSAVVTLANPLYSGELVIGQMQVVKSGAVAWEKTFIAPPGGNPVALTIPMAQLIAFGSSTLRVTLDSLGLQSEVELLASTGEGGPFIT